MKIKFVLLSLITSTSLVGCNGVVSDYVQGVHARNPSSAQPLPANGGDTLKVSPGSVLSQGSMAISMKAHVTPTNKILKSSQMSAKLSLHQQTVTP